MNRNAYFQIVIKDDTNVYLKLFPAVGEGVPLRLDEIIAYLNQHKISGYNLVEIKKAEQRKEITEVKVSSEKVYPLHEEIVVFASQDKMQATARFYPASVPPGDEFKSVEDIQRELIRQKIVYGINLGEVEKFLKNREYCTDYEIAKGKKPVEGKDAVITYHFNTELTGRPKLNDDGSVDFHQLETMNAVKAGDVLATLVKEVHGISGKNISGGEIAPQKVEVKRLFSGKNMTLSEDELQVVSNVDGHVVLGEQDKIVVSNVYEIAGDVDTATGDITYDGDVKIHGNVRTGFSIVAKGNVEVEGVVEGARIISMGNIVLVRGIQGMGRGMLQAQGSVFSKFIESATVSAMGNVEADAIMHSKVSAKGAVYVAGKKGLIVGGHVSAKNLIQAQNIGSPMGGATTVEVGEDPEMRERIKNLESEKKSLSAEEHQVRQVVDAMKMKQSYGKLKPEMVPTFQKALVNYSTIQKRLAEIDKELKEYYEQEKEDTDACIKVEKAIYPGVKIIISGEFSITSNENRSCKFVREWHEIKRLSF